MVSVVGKKIVCVLFLFSSLAAEMRIEITDSDGIPLQCAGVGQPFLVTVVTDAGGMHSQPTIEGIDEYRSGWTEMEMSTFNGKGACRYKFGVRVDEPGTYTFGPARMRSGDHDETCGAVTVEVKQEAHSDGKTKKSNQLEPFARLLVAKDHVFVREPVDCFLRFYSARGDETNVRVTPPQSDDIVIMSQGAERKGSEKIDGREWHYSELPWRLYAKKAGSLVLPACMLDYTMVQPRGFWFSQAQEKHFCSNAVTLNVEALPVCDRPIQGVGSFNRFDAHIEPAVARVGDALVLTLRLEGEGLLDETSTLTLQDMPPALKWYDSKQYDLDPERDGARGKVFEFVVQGLHEGECEIPSQAFTFFTIESRQCRTLQTTPLAVTITPGHVNAPVPSTFVQPPAGQALATDELSPMPEGDGWAFLGRVRYFLPWWLMVLLIGLPGFYVFFSCIRRRWQQSPSIRRKALFSRAYADLAALTQADDVQGLYPLFTRLFGRLYDDPSLDLMSESITTRLRDAGIAPETVERWRQFVERCAECAFYSASHEAVSKESLLLVAKQWLDYLKERL